MYPAELKAEQWQNFLSERGGNTMDYVGHNGKPIVERVSTANAARQIEGLTRVPIPKATAHEVISLSYGFFTPLTGFMSRQEVDGTDEVGVAAVLGDGIHGLDGVTEEQLRLGER